MKIAISICYGRYHLSEKAIKQLEELGIQTIIFGDDIKRNDPKLISVIEKLGDDASDEYSKIKIIEIPDDVGQTFVTLYLIKFKSRY